MKSSTSRRTVGTLLAIAGVVAASGCGSTSAPSTRSKDAKPTLTSAPALPTRRVPLVDPSTTARVQVAVGDRTHGMILTDSSGMAATVFDTTSGTTSAVSLPDLDSGTLVPWSGGYAVGGAHCTKRGKVGVEDDPCVAWVPSVTFLHADGSLDKVVTGTEQRGTDDEGVTVHPGNDAVLFWFGTGAWKLVDRSGFGEIPGTQDMVNVCRVDDGDFISATPPSGSKVGRSPEDQARSKTEEMHGALTFRISHDGVWRDLPVDANDAAKRTSGLAACVAGGLVTGLGTVTDASGPQGGTRAPVGYETTDDLIADAVGIDPTGGILLSLPLSENRPPQVIGGTSTLRSKIDEGDRWAGMSADRHHVLLGNASGARIVTVTD